jgi:hypothetical protein
MVQDIVPFVMHLTETPRPLQELVSDMSMHVKVAIARALPRAQEAQSGIVSCPTTTATATATSTETSTARGTGTGTGTATSAMAKGGF